MLAKKDVAMVGSTQTKFSNGHHMSGGVLGYKAAVGYKGLQGCCKTATDCTTVRAGTHVFNVDRQKAIDYVLEGSCVVLDTRLSGERHFAFAMLCTVTIAIGQAGRIIRAGLTQALQVVDILGLS